jgi:hypothetical protein
MSELKVLIIGNTANVGYNFKKGLISKGHTCHCWFKKTFCLSGFPDSNFLEPTDYDVVHLDFCVLGIRGLLKWWRYIKNAKVLMCYWRGTDLRGKDFPLLKSIPYKIFHYFWKQYLFKRADFHLYSTYDLGWWLRTVPKCDQAYNLQCVDTELFIPINVHKSEDTLVREGGALCEKQIYHENMYSVYNQHTRIKVTPAINLDSHLISVTALEALSCGLTVENHLDKDRDWVIENASIEVYTTKMLQLYKKLI